MADYYLFLDESGDHGIANIDEQYPIFTLCGVICSSDNYKVLHKSTIDLKQIFWAADKKVNLHSHEIRKWQGEFVILMNPQIREGFYDSINKLIAEGKFTVIASSINKKEHIRKYGKLARNVYNIALSFIIERAVFWMDTQVGENKRLTIVIEKRGKKEDTELKKEFSILVDRGTYYVKAERIRNYSITLHFRNKTDDVSGLQIADLIAYPITRYIMERDRANPSFELIRPKIYSKRGVLFGLKVFP